MPRRRKTSRIYFRDGRGFYADFRDFSDVGGGREALIPPGSDYATRDETTAQDVCKARLEQLQAARRGGAVDADPPLRAYARRHFLLKKQLGIWRPSTVRRHDDALRNVLGYFGDDVQLSQITVRRLTEYVAWRARQPGRRPGTTISEQTILHELNALSSLYRRAISEGAAQSNPVASLPDRPKVEREERVWLEVGEAARLLKACRHLDADDEGRRADFLQAIVGLYLLTGVRTAEGFGMLVGDVDFRGGRVWVRNNRFRSVNKGGGQRWVPLWPQLRGILQRHVAGLESSHPSAPLFVSHRTGAPPTTIRRALERALEKAEIDKHVTNHTFRHTYAAARIQTLDGGEPVSLYTVARELGHSGTDQLERTYGHLMDVRVRLPHVEYRETTVLHLALAERAS